MSLFPTPHFRHYLKDNMTETNNVLINLFEELPNKRQGRMHMVCILNGFILWQVTREWQTNKPKFQTRQLIN